MFKIYVHTTSIIWRRIKNYDQIRKEFNRPECYFRKNLGSFLLKKNETIVRRFFGKLLYNFKNTGTDFGKIAVRVRKTINYLAKLALETESTSNFWNESYVKFKKSIKL